MNAEDCLRHAQAISDLAGTWTLDPRRTTIQFQTKAMSVLNVSGPARIVEAAARLIYERGVAGTTLDDVKAAAEVSGSQMYLYFPDKDELVQAVITYQAGLIAGNQRQADLGSIEGLRAWRAMARGSRRRWRRPWTAMGCLEPFELLHGLRRCVIRAGVAR